MKIQTPRNGVFQVTSNFEICTHPQIEDKPADEEATAMYELSKASKHVQALCVPPAIADCKVEHTRLVNVAEEIEGWSIHEFLPKRAEVESWMSSFDKKFDIIIDFHNSMRDCVKELKEKSKKDKRDVRNARYKLVKLLTSNGTPRGIAEAHSDFLKGKECWNQEKLVAPYAITDCDLGELNRALLIKATEAGGSTSGSETAEDSPQAVWNQVHSQLVAMTSEAQMYKIRHKMDHLAGKVLKEHDGMGGSSSLDILDVKWPTSELFATTVSLPPFVHVLRDMCVDVTTGFLKDFFPLVGVPCFVTCSEGHLQIILLSFDSIVSGGETLATLHEALGDKAKAVKLLSKAPL